MIAKTPWNSRTFNFEFPVSHFPFIYSRLMGTPARIAAFIEALSPEVLSFKHDGKWSINEHIGHLIDLEELHDGRLIDYQNGALQLRPADMTNKKTYEANHNASSATDLLNRFTASRKHFLKQLNLMDATGLSRSALHPRLQQPMRVVDMAFFVAEHDDQHLVCMMEILEQQKPGN